MKERQSFVVYKEWRDVVDSMTAEQSKQFLQAMFAYQDGEDIDEIITDASVKMVFALIKKQFDRDTEKYNDMCQKRSEWGKKGAEARQETLAKAKTESSDLAQAKNNLANLAQAKNDLANLADNDNEDDNDDDNDLKEKERAPKGAQEKSAKRFTSPTVDQVREYCKQRQNDVNAEAFVDFYASKGWMVGNNRMKDWKAAVRNWERRDKSVQFQGKPPDRGKQNRFSSFRQREYDFDELEKQLIAD